MERRLQNVSLSSERPPSLHPSVVKLPQRAHAHTRTHAHTHASIFKHAASAWRHDTTPEPKHIEGHSEIAPGHTRWSRFPLWSPFIPLLFGVLLLQKIPHIAISGSSHAFLCVQGQVLLLRSASQHVLDRRAVHGPSGGNISAHAESFCRRAIAAPAAPPPL